MNNVIKKPFRSVLIITLSIIVLVIPLVPIHADENSVIRFSDVPEGHWADNAIHELRLLKITDGIGNNKFGLGLTIKRCEFVAYLVRLMGWELVKPEKGSFIDNMDNSKWYYPYIETALKSGVIPSTTPNDNTTILNNDNAFRPDDPITREEMAVMIVHTLGYEMLTKQLTYMESPFDDVSKNKEYIIIAKDFGIITGTGNNKFKPYNTATREEAAAMMIRMYNRLNQPINELHAFYAIRSANQMDMINDLDSVGFGWSRLEYDEKNRQVVLNTTRNNNNEYAVPEGFLQPYNMARQSKVSAQLMVFADNETVLDIGSNEIIVSSTEDKDKISSAEDKDKISSTGDEDKVSNAIDQGEIPLLEYVLTKPEIRGQVIESIVNQVNATAKDGITISFDGVVIDFESMKGELLKQSFNSFLTELKQELDKTSKILYVAVHPKRKSGQDYYNAYDYKAIGEIADKVILMAHDYYAKKLSDADMQNGYTITPLSPFDEVYYALKAITDKDSGVEDLNKIWLQISFDAVQWKLKDGKVINRYPYSPSYEAIRQKLVADAEMNYSNINQNPYITFYNSGDETKNVIWYEDSRSVQAKIKLAGMFGINGVSLWRLGNVPDYDIWQQILSNKKKLF
ncbi:MAG TPA: S-layer homology domain-containing protein [Clostridiales bacterium]|nr:S-layer homology domain-containing protein [Clostridiales bacterium]